MSWYENNNIPYITVQEPNKFAKGGILTRKKYESYYACGRIDVSDSEPYGSEISVPVMKMESWMKFGSWLAVLYTDEAIYSLKTLIDNYKADTGNFIEFLRDEDKKLYG